MIKSLMVYCSNNELITWFKKYERQSLIITVLLIIFACLAGTGFFFDTRKEIDNKFIFGVIGLGLIIIFFLYAYFNSGSLTNKTIREIEFTDSEVTFSTFSYRLFVLYKIEKKKIVIDLALFKFVQSEYPISNKKVNIKKECFRITHNEDDFFLLFKYYDDNLLENFEKGFKIN
ncbi:hypothetical protein [Flavobacterium sharifuzzamanii]|uniref:hypothetical protein n=1 Tax=Flavobacterium sharifuzzamanii TaxID=2211133 RepID=UPI000DAECF16|nr:hypothetical protein [Flavobacterium sharifuzzamanii]KAF2082770.1 hypothetical protein DMA14_02425 [Flavobacterium sharifuzzamanii]